MSGPSTVTAAVLVIGDEILSGRTKDLNIGYIAEYLGKIGVDVREARVVPDIEEEIVAAVNALRARYDYVITTGGIGPTHDDITADAVARAFGVPIGEDPRVIACMMERSRPGDLTPARRRMARIPAGAELIDNPISGRARIPHRQRVRAGRGASVMQAMLDFAVKSMKTGAVMAVETIEAGPIPGGALRRRARGDRQGESGRLDRLLPVVQGRAVHEPDRGARQGRLRGRGGPAGSRGDAGSDAKRRQTALSLSLRSAAKSLGGHAVSAGLPARSRAVELPVHWQNRENLRRPRLFRCEKTMDSNGLRENRRIADGKIVESRKGAAA